MSSSASTYDYDGSEESRTLKLRPFYSKAASLRSRGEVFAIPASTTVMLASATVHFELQVIMPGLFYELQDTCLKESHSPPQLTLLALVGT